MKARLTLALLILVCGYQLAAQKNCTSFTYQQQQLQLNPSLGAELNTIEAFTRQYISSAANVANRGGAASVIRIPVVVHILYHNSYENISDELVNSQIEILNQCFRRSNADTGNTPARFAGVAADCEIEFQLAISDPRRRNTTGIIRKYTPITSWDANDKMKSNAEMGDDAWDAKSYLNIWVCNLGRVAGYSSVPGGPADKDGVVIGYNVFGKTGSVAGMDKGRTTVHEVGHWLNLRHLWGDDYCGDDGVSDTPKQSGYNSGCPEGVQLTCENGPKGDMYMNYMDYTNDECMNLFTLGQKARMRSLFAGGGARYSILLSTGLMAPLIYETPLPVEDPKWLHPQLFPNPAISEIKLDLSYDVRWIGKIIQVVNLQGQIVMQVPVTNKIQAIQVSKLKPGMYIITSKKEDGEFIREKFIKQ
jgi:hypothetical protein